MLSNAKDTVMTVMADTRDRDTEGGLSGGKNESEISGKEREAERKEVGLELASRLSPYRNHFGILEFQDSRLPTAARDPGAGIRSPGSDRMAQSRLPERTCHNRKGESDFCLRTASSSAQFISLPHLWFCLLLTSNLISVCLPVCVCLALMRICHTLKNDPVFFQ